MLIPPSWLTAWKLLPFSVSSMFQKALRELGPRALTYLLLPTESKPCVNYGSTEGNLSVGAEQAMAELETDLKGGIVHSDRFFFFFLPLLPAWSLHFTSGSLLHSSCWLSVKTAQKYWIIALLCFNCFLERSMYHVAYTHVSWELAKAALQMSFCVYAAIYGEANDRKCKSWHFHISNGKPPPLIFSLNL